MSAQGLSVISALPNQSPDPLTLVIGERPIFALKQERPEIDVGDVDGRVRGRDGHVAGKRTTCARRQGAEEWKMVTRKKVDNKKKGEKAP